MQISTSHEPALLAGTVLLAVAAAAAVCAAAAAAVAAERGQAAVWQGQRAGVRHVEQAWERVQGRVRRQRAKN